MAAYLRPKTAWLLVAASVLFAALLLYTLFVGYMPAKQRVGRLEAELREIYRREAELQTQLARQSERLGPREQEVRALRAERDALARRVEGLERELAAARRR